MTSLDEIITESKDVREVKRAVSVKMLQQGIPAAKISMILNVSLQYISQWKTVYASKGAASLSMAYKGSQGYLTKAQHREVLQGIAQHTTLQREELIAHIAEAYHVLYQSKPSYYRLLEDGGRSSHRSEAMHPRHNTDKVLTRREEITKQYWHNKPTLLLGIFLGSLLMHVMSFGETVVEISGEHGIRPRQYLSKIFAKNTPSMAYSM